MSKLSHSEPPKLWLKFFQWFCHPDFVEEIEGDLYEQFQENLTRKGIFYARWQYAFAVISLLRLNLMRPIYFPHPINDSIMFRQNFKISFRYLTKNKSYAFLNIGGLAMGMTLAILIGLWVYDELTFDAVTPEREHIARVMQHRTIGKEKKTWFSTMRPLAEQLRIDYGHLFETVVKGTYQRTVTIVFEDQSFDKEGQFFEPDFPAMIDLNMVNGNQNGLSDPNAIMIRESFAHTLFGTKDPIGQTLMTRDIPMKITGVFKDFPDNSSFAEIEYFGSWDLLLQIEPWIGKLKNPWGMSGFLTLAKVSAQTDMTIASNEIKNLIIENVQHDKDALSTKPEAFLHPMSKWYLQSRFEHGKNTGGRIDNVWMFGLIGCFVLLIACINFMNLSTARSEKRAKEVGVRKTLGSVRSELMGQFFSESLLISFGAFIIALVITQLAMPWFNQISNKELTLLNQWPMLFALGFCFVFLSGILAGSYPAIYLSSFRPIETLKSTFRVGKNAALPRKVLIVFQFTVSVAMIICVSMVYKQLDFIKNRPVGYVQNGLINVFTDDVIFDEKYDIIQEELVQTNLFSEIARSKSPITRVWSTSGSLDWRGKDPNMGADFPNTGVESDYGSTIGWEILEGRDFSDKLNTDSSAFIVNEAAVKFMNLENPIGETVKWDNEPFTIIGVIKDMIIETPYHPSRPHFYHIADGGSIMNVRLREGVETSVGLEKIEAVIKGHFPNFIMDYAYADELYARKFRGEELVGKLVGLFAILAIIISCLGLFGLAAYIAEKRTKEIGIRKVLGASVIGIWQMLSKDFLVLVMIACCFAFPLAYYLVTDWLSNADFQTEISVWIFGRAFALCGLVTLLTVSVQTFRAATKSPIDAMRIE